MLRENTVESSTLELLNRIMSDVLLQDFVLVGGTALALQLGHRKSIDLDLFCIEPFNEARLLDHLRIDFSFELDFIEKNTIKGEVKGVKLDFLTHPYPWIDEPFIEEPLRIASHFDIAAMKLNAISGNGTRLKDFIDLAFLSERMSLLDMLNSYEKKYKSNPVMPLKAITFFDDINFNEPINLLVPNIFKWKVFEKRLIEMQKEPGKVFPKF